MIVEDWGLIDYSLALQRQKIKVGEVALTSKGMLVFCEHPPVLTLGRMTRLENILYSKEHIKSLGISICPCDRGGDVTLHAPGQLVVYPILNLNNYGRGLKWYMEKLEQVAVDLLNSFGILAVSVKGQRGVFVSGPLCPKIVSIGVGVRKWVTYHGLAVNVNTDLKLFDCIKPCGLDVQMTSMRELKGNEIAMADVKASLVKQFQKYFTADWIGP
jgi:lipoyl(octanoyl) transferase